MVKKILILIFSLYFLALLQTSFLIHFNIFGIIPNLLLILVLLLNLFEKPEKNSGILAAGVAGFFLDIFSERPMGISILILVGLAFLMKLILRKYVRPIIRLGVRS